MIEVRIQIRITESDVQRVRIVRHRKKLGSRRLVRPSEVEKSDIGILRELIIQHGLRRPVYHLASVCFMTCGFVVCVCRVHRCSQLSPELLFLIAEIHSGPLGDGTVENAVGVSVVDGLSCRVKDKESAVKQVSTAVEGILI